MQTFNNQPIYKLLTHLLIWLISNYRRFVYYLLCFTPKPIAPHFFNQAYPTRIAVLQIMINDTSQSSRCFSSNCSTNLRAPEAEMWQFRGKNFLCVKTNSSGELIRKQCRTVEPATKMRSKQVYLRSFRHTFSVNVNLYPVNRLFSPPLSQFRTSGSLQVLFNKTNKFTLHVQISDPAYCPSPPCRHCRKRFNIYLWRAFQRYEWIKRNFVHEAKILFIMHLSITRFFFRYLNVIYKLYFQAVNKCFIRE